ncbi:MAG TPA: C13 family peptidase [Casimicrobiaceae bacterium]|nr:C13 family peptidase [Casimicrobiaceae bacterium]
MADATQDVSARRGLLRNLRAGLRVVCFLGMRGTDVVADWTQFAMLLVLSVLSTLVWQMATVGWPGYVNLWALPETLFFVPLLCLAAWSMAALGRRADETLALVVSVMSAGLWLDAFIGLATLVADHLPAKDAGPWVRWILFYVAVGWFVACLVVAASRRVALAWPARPLATLLAVAVVGYPLLTIGHDRTLWTKPYEESDAPAARADYDAVAREDVLYLQPRLLERDLAQLLPRQAGRPNLYLIGVAGYADQDVFRREVDAVDALFAERFGTRGRSLRLVNNRATVRTTPIATHTALAESLKRVGGLMDPEQDILFLFLTSHGSKNGRFSLSFYPLHLTDLTALELRGMLDEAGIRNRVIVVSSCYSGGFVEPLKDDDTLVMTASSRDRNSFGCSNEADFTYFGKAYFDEALRATDSFTEAFARALPVIAARERKDDYKPSQPQSFVGARIEAKLAAWREARPKNP